LSKTKSFRAKVNKEKQTLSFYDRQAFLDFIQTIPGEIDITVTEVSSRTHWQNRYYHGVVIKTLMQDETFGGYTKQEVHDTLKLVFNVKSTAKLSIEEFTEYIDKIMRWAAEEHQIMIPDANDEF
tara:strand:- start:27 stop:401 length:375 start_codon:yes stop_codon:yes gene_type:complete